jgi:hypothetical protein
MGREEFKEKLIALLETEGQTTTRLFEFITPDKCNYCIEGLICRVLGGSIKNLTSDMMTLEGKDIGGYVNPTLYSDYLPSSLNSDFVLNQSQLNLNEYQKSQLENKFLINCIYLNDKCGFTFTQFIKLIKVL